MNLYDKLGPNTIRVVVADFYDLVFADPMISFFFEKADRERLVKQQQAFVEAMLGGPKSYEGKPLIQAHKDHPIREAHFNRRLTLLKETMESYDIDPEIIEGWLKLERNLKKVIISSNPIC